MENHDTCTHCGNAVPNDQHAYDGSDVYCYGCLADLREDNPEKYKD